MQSAGREQCLKFLTFVIQSEEKKKGGIKMIGFTHLIARQWLQQCTKKLLFFYCVLSACFICNICSTAPVGVA